MICEESIDIETNLAEYSKTYKVYYGEGVEASNGKEDFEFEYNEDGSLAEVFRHSLDDEWDDSELFSPENFIELIENFSEDIDFSYYLTAKFEI